MSKETATKTHTGKVYHSKKVKERKTYIKVCGWIAMAGILVYGFGSMNPIAIILGVLMGLAMIMEQREMVTNRGLEVFYDLRVFDYTDLWPWEEMTSLHREDQGHPTLVALHFGKGITTRRYAFTKADAQAIMNLARERNPKMSVGDADVVKKPPKKKR